MIRLRCSTPLLLSVLLLLLFLVSTGMEISRAAEPERARSCRADQLGGAKVSASAKIDHHDRDYSTVTSIMEIKIPATWEHSSDLLLDTHAPQYHEALRCLLGKVSEKDFYDYDEWRLKPLAVNADEKEVVVHYEAFAWVLGIAEYRVGPWRLEVDKNVWGIQLTPASNLARADWEDVQVRLDGPGALSATPPPTIGEKGRVLRWQHNKQVKSYKVEFRPPTAQQWSAITLSTEQIWEVLGPFSGSGVAWYVATGALLLIVVKRLRRDLEQPPTQEESRALKTLQSWALLQALFGLVVYMGDNVYRFLSGQFSWSHDYGPTVALYSILFIGLTLCFFGKLQKGLLAVACVSTVSVAGISIGNEVTESGLLPTSDSYLSHTGYWFVLIAYAAAVFVFCMGAVSVGRRVLLMDRAGLPWWVMVSVSAGVSASTLLWALLAFWRYWNRITWLADASWFTYRGQLLVSYDSWWWQLVPDQVSTSLWDCAAIILPALALVGTLRVCRAERRDQGSFTPTQAEKFLLMAFFAVVVPGYGNYFGFSFDTLSLILSFCAVWALISLTRSRSVLEQPSGGNVLLGNRIMHTDRTELFRLVRHYRELQNRLHRLSVGNSTEEALAHEVIEREIDQLGKGLPEGIRPVDVAFAFGPKTTWWDNACRCALIACFVGVPATALMYWVEMAGKSSWVQTAESPAGFPLVVFEVLYWHSTWVGSGFFLGALWRDLPGRHGPTKAFCVAIAFAIPAGVHEIIATLIGQSQQNATSAIAVFVSVMTFTGFVMDVQTFQSERRYWPTSASLVVYVYQMKVASAAFFLAQILALVTIWKALREGGPVVPPPSR
ncbi:DUF6185 family protein [Streptomyces chattanoogensis]|uniref:DUF6185 family protein n=1 Tax=Streptomyces chattanoogensis TaxID=66876 RepID=UPI00367D31D3